MTRLSHTAPMTLGSYAELDAISNFSFLRGASHPEELIERASNLNLFAIGIADDNTLAGVVRAHITAKHKQVKLLIGARLIFSDDTPDLLIYPVDITGYQSLSRLLTTGKMRAKKGKTELYLSDLYTLKNVLVLVVPPERIMRTWSDQLIKLKAIFPHNLFCTVSFLQDGFSDNNIAQLIAIEKKFALPMVVTNSVIAHDKSRRALADVLSCIKNGTNLYQAGKRLQKNSERYLKPPREMWRLFARLPQWLERSVTIAKSITFSLDDLRYQYPSQGHATISDQDFLIKETMTGAQRRYGEQIPNKIAQLLEEELKLVGELGYATYFLTVYDIVNFARSKGILCQGRGSAANSAICFCLGITEVDPNTHNLLFGRFISRERNEPPDIDVDFENSAREEVMQYVFNKYSRNHAAITATVITYRKRMAVREVAKVFGLPIDAIDNLIRAIRGIALDDIVASLNSCDSTLLKSTAHDAGIGDHADTLRHIVCMAALLLRFPRHLGQHVGGFVINQYPLSELVPVGNAAMPGRTFIEWDKNDLDALGILKIDILALGMLSAIKRSFHLIKKHYGQNLSLSNIPQEDAKVYAMLARADSIGVFQVESRAQMSMLPRLKPKTFYDLVIQVAIIRPGPIQGNMVHPYLRRRSGQESITYPSAALEKVLSRTLGVPLFQEQVMQIAIVAAGFTPGEADHLRRSMATFKRLGKVGDFYERFVTGMTNNGYEKDFAERVFNQILGFAEYGFPESHAASFANLVYVSAWLKCYYPAAFACALLNSQPMGFYGSAQIIADTSRHNVRVLPIDINHSKTDNCLEVTAREGMAIRLGFCEIKGVSSTDLEWLVACRPQRGYSCIADVFSKSSITKATLVRLSKAQVFNSFDVDERQAQWQIMGLVEQPPPLFASMIFAEEAATFAKISEFDRVHLDYSLTGFSLGKHPMAFIRHDLSKRGYASSQDLSHLPHGSEITVAGLVIIRQRPATAKGVIFFTLEDEFGLMNIVVWPTLAESHRKEVLLSTAIAIKGRCEKKDHVHHVIAMDIKDLSFAFHRLNNKSRDFR